MNYIELDLEGTPISWNTLFPTGIWSAIGYNQRDFISLIPPKYRNMGDNKDLANINDCNNSVVSKFFNLPEYGGYYKQYNRIKGNIFRYANSGNFSFETFDLINDLKINLTNLLESMPSETREKYKDDITEFIKIFLDELSKTNNRGEYEGLRIYQAFSSWNIRSFFEKDLKDFESRFTLLFLIAMTWPFWVSDSTGQNYYNDTVKALAMIIFPSPPRNIFIKGTTNEWKQSQTRKEKQHASDLLKSAEDSFYHAKEYEVCGDTCRVIINLCFVANSDRGKAYYLLVKCHDDHKYRYKGYYNSAEFMRQAISYECVEARNEWKTIHMDSLCFKSKPSKISDAYIVFNDSPDNERIISVLKTLPKNTQNDTSKDYVFYKPLTSDLIKTVSTNTPLKYLLIHNDLKKNFHDLLYILDTIKTWEEPRFLTPKNTNDSKWNITIYLRTNEEEYSALLDTALKHMDSFIARVYTIDDAKWPVQRLLNRHPLFYPIRSLNGRILQNQSVILNYIVISQEDDNLTNRLIREAYWLGSFWYKGITFAITIISPKAKQIESRLRFDCPGMFGATPKTDNISSFKCSFINTPYNSLNSPDLFSELESIKDAPNSFSYFVVNAGNDLSSLNISIKLREWSIRKTIHSNDNLNDTNLPIIAYYCQDSDIAHLSNSMVVQMEENGDSWYNNYSLIPFGMLHEKYSWEELDGGYLEQVSLATHLQYCGIKDSTPFQEKRDMVSKYFNRSYNRDSSMAVAISLPYRLFQTSIPNNEISHIVPDGWNIYNENAYTDCSDIGSVKEMAKLFRENLGTGENQDHLLLYEHTRWIKWMISRGWQESTAEETIAYIKAGNPRQQLYIARLHSCLCSLDQLEKLQESLYNPYLDQGDSHFLSFKPENSGSSQNIFNKFKKIDQSNINNTPELMTVAWSMDDKEEEKTEERYE